MFKIFNSFRLEIIIFILIIFIYFLLRLPNLTLQPIFADEAIYIRWAQVMKAEPTLRFLPLSDGKTPLFMWLLTPLFKIFDDPLYAGRFLSVISGFGTLIGVFLIGWKFFNLKAGLWAAFLIASVPWMVFFDRMALVDSMLSAFSIWSLFLALLLIKYPRIDLAMVLGYVLGGAILTKTPGMFNLLVLPTTLITFKWLDKDRQQKLLKLFGLWIIAFIITMVIYNLLRLGPGFLNLSSRNQDYIFSPLELIGRPLDPFIPHLKDLADWAPKLLTWPVLLIVVLGIVSAFLKKNRFALTIFFWSLIPLLVQSFLLKTFTARYLLFSIPPLLVLGGYFIAGITSQIKLNPILKILLLIFFLVPPVLNFTYKLITDPALAPLPKQERRGYLEDWTAGYGLKETAQFLIEQSKEGVVVVGTEGSFGTLPDGLEIYLDKYFHTAPKENQIIVIGGKAVVSDQIKEAAKNHQTFFVSNKSRFIGDYNTEEILNFPKAKSFAGSQDAILLFKVFLE